MMVEVPAPLPVDQTGTRETKVHAIVNGLVVKKSRPRSHNDAGGGKRAAECGEEKQVENTGYDQTVSRTHEQPVRIARRCVMREMRRIHNLAQARIAQRQLNVKHETVQSILQQRPD